METDRAFGQLSARCSGIKRDQLVAANDCGRDAIGKKLRFFSRPEAGKREYRFADAGFANLLALLCAGDAQPVGTGFLKGFGDLWAAVAVAVAFDDGENLSRSSALFGFRIHEIANSLKIVRNRGE